jgi:hypothetical protein
MQPSSQYAIAVAEMQQQHFTKALMHYKNGKPEAWAP